MEWLNVFGLIFVALILLPNIIYAFKFRDKQNKCTNKVMNILEQAGRYGCMFLIFLHPQFYDKNFLTQPDSCS